MPDPHTSNRKKKSKYPKAEDKAERFREFCPLCGALGGWKNDKNGRPYLACYNCRTRIFPSGRLSLVGIDLMQDLIRKFGLSRFQQLYQRRIIQGMHDPQRMKEQRG